MSLKYLHSSFGALPEANTAVRWDGLPSAPDPVLSGSNSQSAFAMDMGFLYRFAKHYSLGLQLANINEPNVAFGSGESDKVPFGLKLGFNYRSLISNLVAQFDTAESPTGSRDNIITLAAERWFPKLLVGDFGARGGLGFGSREYAQISMGLSYRVRRFALDYGFGIPLKGVSSTAGSHRVALTFRFGRPTDEEETLEMVLEAMRSMKAQTSAPVRFRVEGAGLSPTERATLEEHLAHGRLLEMSARYKDALDKYEQALKIAPNDKDLLVHHRRLSLVAGRFLQLPEYRTDPVQAALHQGFKAYLSGQDSVAVEKLVSALELKPGDRDVEDILTAIEKESGLGRPAPLPEKRSASYSVAAKLTRAETASEERRYNEAIELCLDILREDKENVEAWQILGTSYFALKDFEASLDAWRRAYELQKSPSLRAAIKGHIRSIEHLREVKPAERREVRPAPVKTQSASVRATLSAQEIQTIYDKGVEYYLRRDLDNAQKMFERILESDPFNAEAGKALRRIREEKP
jgi:tetratricopeptide (TPR) repeat protein